VRVSLEDRRRGGITGATNPPYLAEMNDEGITKGKVGKAVDETDDVDDDQGPGTLSKGPVAIQKVIQARGPSTLPHECTSDLEREI